MHAVPTCKHFEKLCMCVCVCPSALRLQSLSLRKLCFAVSCNFCSFNEVSSSQRLYSFVDNKTPFVKKGDLFLFFWLCFHEMKWHKNPHIWILPCVCMNWLLLLNQCNNFKHILVEDVRFAFNCHFAAIFKRLPDIITSQRKCLTTNINGSIKKNVMSHPRLLSQLIKKVD